MPVILIRNVVPVGFPDYAKAGATDVLVGADGRVAAIGPGLPVPDGARQVDGRGAYLSPGWTDLHVHVWHGGTDLSIRPLACGVAQGVTTLVDAGSAGEASFAGFREYVMDPARERVRAFLNIGSIGLVACNRVSELATLRSINVDRTLATIEANRDRIVGIKIRASHVILGDLGIEPVKLARKVARLADLPLMAHVGEPPPHYGDVLRELDPGDIITHCFNGKTGSSLKDDPELLAAVHDAVGRGIRLDIGHGGASYSMEVAKFALDQGLVPDSISTDLHRGCQNKSVFDLATTMSKLLAAGMPFEKVVEAATLGPAQLVKLDLPGSLAVGAPAEFTLFELSDEPLDVIDSNGLVATLDRVFEPRQVILGSEVIAAARHIPPTATS